MNIVFFYSFYVKYIFDRHLINLNFWLNKKLLILLDEIE